VAATQRREQQIFWVVYTWVAEKEGIGRGDQIRFANDADRMLT